MEYLLCLIVGLLCVYFRFPYITTSYEKRVVNWYGGPLLPLDLPTTKRRARVPGAALKRLLLNSDEAVRRWPPHLITTWSYRQ